MINVKNGRGVHILKKKAENTEKVRRFFENNPGTTMSDCARYLGIANNTVARAVRDIMAEEETP